MNTLIEATVTLCDLLFIILILLTLIYLIKSAIEHRKYKKEYEWKKTILLSDMADVIRWCSYEFPQTEEVAKRVIRIMNNQSVPDIDQFRSNLRRKYEHSPEDE